MGGKSTKWIGTGEAARLLMMKTSIFKATYYGTGDVCGIVPEQDPETRLLKWPKEAVIKESIRRQADCVVMLRTLQGVADWMAEQRIQTEDERIEMLYHVLQTMEEKY